MSISLQSRCHCQTPNDDGVICTSPDRQRPPKRNHGGRGLIHSGGGPPSGKAGSAAPARLPVTDAGGGGAGSSGDGPPRAAVPVPLPPPPDPPAREVDDGVMAVHEPGELAPKRRRVEPNERMCGIWGARVAYKDYTQPDGVRSYQNWKIKCKLGHKPCFKTMGASAKNTRNLGVLEPLAFLHAWFEKHWEPQAGGQSHASSKPSAEEVKACLEAHRDELQAIHDLALG